MAVINEALGIVPSKFSEIDSLSLESLDATQSGIVARTRSGEITNMVGQFAAKLMARIGVYDGPSIDVPIVNWYLPFMPNLTLANPSTLPSGSVNALAWSSDGQYLAVGEAASPFVDIYKRSGDILSRINTPNILPGHATLEMGWSPDGKYLAVSHSSSPYVHIYLRAADSFVLLMTLSNMIPPAATVTRALSWSPDGKFLAVGFDVPPFFIWIQIDSNDAFTKMSAVSSPGNEPHGLAWDPSSTYLAISMTNALTVFYKKTDGVLAKLPNPSPLPSGATAAASWSPDGKYVAFPTSVSPYLVVYKRSGDMFIKLSDPATLPTGSLFAVTWSPDGKYLACGGSVSPFFMVYGIDDEDTLIQLPNMPILSGTSRSLSFSPDGNYLAAVNGSVTPFFNVYKAAGDVYGGTPKRIELIP